MRFACGGIATLLLCACAPSIVRDLEIPQGAVDDFKACLRSATEYCRQSVKTAAATVEASFDTSLPPDLRDWSEKQAKPQKQSQDRNGLSMEDVFVESLLADVLNHPFQTKLNGVAQALLREQKDDHVKVLSPSEAMADDEETEPFHFSYREFRDYYSRVNRLTTMSGLGQRLCKGVNEYAEKHPGNVTAERSARTCAYLEAYWKAYFRGGRFYTVEITATDGEAELTKKLDDLVARLRSDNPLLSDDAMDSFRKRLHDELHANLGNLYRSWGEISDAGFVTRSGATYQSPSVSGSFDLFSGDLNIEKTNFDSKALVSDLRSGMPCSRFRAAKLQQAPP
jgi:hypothetical protein